MKTSIRIVFCTLLMLSAVVAVTQEKPAVKDLNVKSTPASDLLVQLSKDTQADQAAFNVKVQQARSNLDQSVKSLNDQLASLRSKLNADLEKDKKYKPTIEQIAALQKQITDINTKANADFNQESIPISQKLGTEKAQIQSLIDVVRKENNFPANAVYSEEKQTWSAPETGSDKK